MLVRSLLVLLAAGNLLAVEAGTTVLRPPDLSKLSPKQFQQLLSKGLAEPSEVEIARLGGQKPGSVCSIPLLKWKVNYPERFNMRRLPAGSNKIDPMAIPPPAPECPDK